jgi:hypothetical protein
MADLLEWRRETTGATPPASEKLKVRLLEMQTRVDSCYLEGYCVCSFCNGFKSDQIDALDPVTNRRVALFNPRRQKWAEHFAWSRDGTQMLGKTPSGRATVIALQLNNAIAVTVRSHWGAAGWHPPSESAPDDM